MGLLVAVLGLVDEVGCRYLCVRVIGGLCCVLGACGRVVSWFVWVMRRIQVSVWCKLIAMWCWFLAFGGCLVEDLVGGGVIWIGCVGWCFWVAFGCGCLGGFRCARACVGVLVDVFEGVSVSGWSWRVSSFFVVARWLCYWVQWRALCSLVVMLSPVCALRAVVGKCLVGAGWRGFGLLTCVVVGWGCVEWIVRLEFSGECGGF